GIYDMSGNVWEWCSDRYGLYLISVQTNPYNCSGSSRVTRGGSWSDFASSARVANRDGKLPTGSYSYIGFRICRTVFEDTAESKEISEDGINKTSKSRKGESVVAKENTEETNDGKADNYVNETHSEEQELQTIHQGEKIDHHETPVKKRRIALPLFIFFTVLVTIAIAVMSLQGHLSSSSVPPMVLVERGSFTMGDTWGDGESDEKPTHKVTFTYDFYLGKYEITFDEYDDFCEATGRSKPKDEDWGRGQRPVINVSWDDAIGFCNWLSEKDKLPKAYDNDGNLLDKDGRITADPANVVGYRLPTEAEWEYAARGGNKSKGYKYSGSDNVDKVAWYGLNLGSKTQEVGKKTPNELGIYDMSGNVWEWCSDRYGHYSSSAKTNPYNDSGSGRVDRGGGWSNLATVARVANRGNFSPTFMRNNLGFRIARTVP
ncbi:SUMF1/EgtB/PvdO family nonheme iron enzyme, partial [Mesotoga sp. TolDC]|uniref:formylglycine-generating enzyme family protein n=2 Tax=unclassified Mesotoga TaxID=1184398 RepID=UPI0021AC5623